MTTSGFTTGARRFAEGKPIELIDGTKLLAIVRSVPQNAAITNAHTPAPSLLRFSDLSATMEEIADWSADTPKPFALQIRMTLPEFWDFFWSGWGPMEGEPDYLLYLLYYHAAAYHLLEDATFRPSAEPPPIRKLFEERVGKITAAIREGIRTANETALHTAYAFLRAHNSNLDNATEVCQMDVEPLCVQYWWKTNGSTFMLPPLPDSELAQILKSRKQ